MAETEVTKREEKAVQTAHGSENESIYVPDIDISENNECIRLVANMPGADQTSIDVTVENNVLTLEGRARIETPVGYELVGQEYDVGKYRRDFTLSNAIDTEGIKARMQNGVLLVTIPKRDEVKTRKIEIES